MKKVVQYGIIETIKIITVELAGVLCIVNFRLPPNHTKRQLWFESIQSCLQGSEKIRKEFMKKFLKTENYRKMRAAEQFLRI